MVYNVAVIDNGQAISVPVGQQVLGRIFNVLGEPIDNGIAIETDINVLQFTVKHHHFMN